MRARVAAKLSLLRDTTDPPPDNIALARITGEFRPKV